MDIRSAGDEITCRIPRLDPLGDCVVWKFSGCFYIADENRLWCPACTHYREHIDLETSELVQEDWWINDMAFACFTFAEGEDALVGCDIPGFDAPLALRRAGEGGNSGA